MRFYCEGCRTHFDAEGDCPNCEFEVLLDLEDEDVRLYLQDRDDESKRKRYAQMVGLSCVLCLPVLVLAFMYWPEPTNRYGRRSGGLPMELILYGISVMAVASVLVAVFPHKRSIPKGGF